MKCVLAAIAFVLLGCRTVTAQVSVTTVDFTARDGAKLKATYYSPGKPGAAMLLLHQCNMDRAAWKTLGEGLAQNGIHALAFDYRGYGESARTGGRSELASDIDTALATLKGLPGVNSRLIGAAGASCGVDNAVQLARRSGHLAALVLLSGPTSPTGLSYLREHPSIPIFAASSSTEDFAVTSLRDVTATSTHKATTLRVVDKPGHGTPLFDVEPPLLTTVIGWVRTVLQ